MKAGTLHTVTRTLRVPLYSGCSLKNLVVRLLLAALAASASVGSRTSQVAKLFRQKYWQGMPAFFRSSSNASFFNPTRRRVLRSETTTEGILGSNASTLSGMGKISLPTKYWAYLPTRSLSKSSGLLCWTFHGAGLFCPG